MASPPSLLDPGFRRNWTGLPRRRSAGCTVRSRAAGGAEAGKGRDMANETQATRALAKAGVPFSVHAYDYDPGAERVGLQAAEALGEAPHRVLKTLMALVDGRPVCAIVASDAEVAMKKLAAAFGGKAAEMMKPADAERLTGYKVGGISPFGQKRRVPTAIEEQAMGEDLVYINGGQRGLQVRLDPKEARRVLDALAVPLIR